MKDQDTTGETGAARPGAREPQAQTLPAQGEKQREVPRMPHERDESGDSQTREQPTAGDIGEIARRDAERGVADTTRGAELDKTYHQLRNTPSREGGGKT